MSRSIFSRKNDFFPVLYTLKLMQSFRSQFCHREKKILLLTAF